MKITVNDSVLWARFYNGQAIRFSELQEIAARRLARREAVNRELGLDYDFAYDDPDDSGAVKITVYIPGQIIHYLQAMESDMSSGGDNRLKNSYVGYKGRGRGGSYIYELTPSLAREVEEWLRLEGESRLGGESQDPGVTAEARAGIKAADRLAGFIKAIS